MKSFITMLLLLCASVVSAQSVYLPAPVKGQTGFYQVQAEDDPNVVRSVGVSLEVFAPGERLLSTGGSLIDPFVFGALYDNNGNFYTIGGVPSGQSLTSGVFATRDSITFQVGTIVLTVDPNAVGDAYTISYSIAFSEDGFRFIGETELSGQFRRLSDAPIIGCMPLIPFSPIPPPSACPTP